MFPNIDPTGAADSSAGLQAAINLLAGTGINLVVPAGTYTINTTVNISSDITIILSPGVIINGNINGTYPLTGSIFRTGLSGAAQGTTTLNGTPSSTSRNITVTSASGASVGGFIYLANATTGFRAIYQIEAMSGNVLTLDRNPDPAFINGDPVTFWNSSQVPQRIRLYGNGARIRGKAVVTISFQTAWDCEVSDLIFDAASATNPSDAWFGWNNACYNCVARRLHADGYGGGSPSVGFAPESGDSCRFEFCTVQNAAGYGMSFEESRNCTFLSCKVTNCLYGFVWANDLVSNYGSDFCSTIDCEASGCTNDAFYMGSGSRHATMTTCRSGRNGGHGCYVDGSHGVFGTDIDLDSYLDGLGGIVVTPGAVATTIRSLRVELASTYALQAQADAAVGNLMAVCAGNVGVQAILHSGGNVFIDKINITHSNGSTAAYVIESTGGNLVIKSGYLALGVNGDVGISSQGGGTIAVESLICTAINGAAGTFGIYSTAGTTKIGFGFDATGCATPIGNGGGTVSMAQDEGANVKVFGAKGDGITDDSTSFQSAINALAGSAFTGSALYIPEGTYKIASPVLLSNNTNIICSPQATFVGAISGSPITQSLFYAPIPSTTATTTLASAPTFGSITISTNASITAGSYIQLVGVAAGYTWIGHVISVSGGGPFTVTLDRPIFLPFTTGDTVNVLSAKPVTAHIQGNGAKLTGQAVAYITGVMWNSVIDNFVLQNLTGSNNDAGIGFISGSYNCVVRNCYLDGNGAGASFNAGFFSEADCCGIENCAVVNGGSLATGIKFADATNGWAYNCAASGCYYGVAFSTDTSSPSGCYACRVIGGHYDGNVGLGGCLIFNGSKKCFVGGGATFNNNAQHGIYVGSGSDHDLADVIANGNGTNGIYILSGTKGTRIGTAQTDSNTDVGVVCEDEAWIGYHSVRSPKTVAGVSALSVTGTGPVKVSSGRYDYTGVSAALFVVVVSGASRVDLNDIEFSLNTNSIAIDPTSSGAVVNCSGLRIAPIGGATGTIGFYGVAGIVRIGADCDCTAATPIGAGGATMQLSQRADIATQNSTGALTFAQLQCSEIESSGNAAGTVTITGITNVKGQEWLCRNNNTSSSTTTFFGVTVAVGKTARVRINSSGVGERSMADT